MILDVTFVDTIYIHGFAVRNMMTKCVVVIFVLKFFVAKLLVLHKLLMNDC